MLTLLFSLIAIAQEGGGQPHGDSELSAGSAAFTLAFSLLVDTIEEPHVDNSVNDTQTDDTLVSSANSTIVNGTTKRSGKYTREPGKLGLGLRRGLSENAEPTLSEDDLPLLDGEKSTNGEAKNNDDELEALRVASVRTHRLRWYTYPPQRTGFDQRVSDSFPWDTPPPVISQRFRRRNVKVISVSLCRKKLINAGQLRREP